MFRYELLLVFGKGDKEHVQIVAITAHSSAEQPSV